MSENHMLFKEDEMLERLQGDKEIAGVLMKTFLEDTPQRLALLRTAIAEQNAEEARLLAHAMKGGALVVGGARFSDILTEMETAGKSGDIEQALLLLPEVEKQFTALKNRMEMSTLINKDDTDN